MRSLLAWRTVQRGSARLRAEDVRPDAIYDRVHASVGKLNFPIIKERVEDIIVVTDEVRRAGKRISRLCAVA